MTQQEYIHDAFREGGQIAAFMDGYLPRDGQVQLAVGVDQAVRDGRCLMAEVPAGVGKTFGYGVPVIHQMAATRALKPEDRTRALIVTSNIALQEQLVERDLPFLREALPFEFEFALMKGRGNYLCLSKRDAFLEEIGKLNAEMDVSLRDVIDWSEQTKTGDRSELEIEPPPVLWSKLSAGEGDCKSAACARYGDCFHVMARERAVAADVVVCNYHLLFAKLAMLEQSPDGRAAQYVLPDAEFVVLDEAHRAADIARDFFGFRVSQRSFDRAAGLLGKIGKKDVRAAVKAAGEDFVKRLRVHRRSDRYKVRLKRKNEIDATAAVLELAAAAKAYKDEMKNHAGDDDACAELGQAAARCRKLSARIDQAQQLAGDDMVYYIEESDRGWVSLCSKAAAVSDRLRKLLFDKVRSAVMVSATLTVGGKFGHAAGELGVPDDRAELLVGTPFNFERNCMLVVPDGMPDPTSRDFVDGVGGKLAEVVEWAGGRTLALFTSRRCMQVARLALRDCPRTVLVQGDAPRTRLVEQFREDVDSVLLGLDSFWAGVDVPGEACTVVVIDRLPFPTPDDPVLDVVKGKVKGAWFKTYSIPRAVTAFRQGFGRLIRSVHDRGVVVVLDTRLVDKPYGKMFLSSLPRTLLTRDLKDAEHLLQPERPNRGRVRAAIDAMEGI